MASDHAGADVNPASRTTAHDRPTEHSAVQWPLILHAEAAGWDLEPSREKKNA